MLEGNRITGCNQRAIYKVDVPSLKDATDENEQIVPDLIATVITM